MATAGSVFWDGRTLGGWDARTRTAQDIVINLAGRSVDCRYHARNRKLMKDSRVDSTRVLGLAVAQCSIPPRVLAQLQHSHNLSPYLGPGLG
jgi:NAD dependent epimerase/dehydratase family enzyme